MKSEDKRTNDYFESVVVLFRERKYDQVINELKEYFLKNPSNITMYGILGASHFMLDQYEQASNWFRLVLKENPKSEIASSQLFHCYNELGKSSEALDELVRYLSNFESTKGLYTAILEDLYLDLNNPFLIGHKAFIETQCRKYGIL